MIRRILTCLTALALLFMLAPIMLALAVLIRWKLGGPVFFRQQRPGYRGRPFALYKFRTMTDERDAQGHLLPDERRLPRFGALLRRTSLDELPQLFSVLKGDMNFVGPRPLLMEYLPLYDAEQARRHDVKPGVTGWAQVNGRNAISWEERFKLDVWYVDHHSFWIDLRILARTLATVVCRRGISAEGHDTMPKFRGTGREGDEGVPVLPTGDNVAFSSIHEQRDPEIVVGERPVRPRQGAEQARCAPLWLIGLVAFLYTAAMAVFIQFVVLPHVVPQWNDGHGLLRGGDSDIFHRYATELAEKVRQQGFSAWERAPHNLPLVGVVGVLYALTVPEPWVLIPINAAFNALAVIMFVLIVESVVGDRRIAAWCALPFLLYPSALLWNTQIHNDVFFIPGMLLVLYGWIVLAHRNALTGWTRPLLGSILILGGASTVWVVRPYGVQLILGTGAILALFLSVLLAVRARKGIIGRSRAAVGAILVWSILAALYPLSRQSFSDVVDHCDAVLPDGKTTQQEHVWTRTTWIPGKVDAVFLTMARVRQGSATYYPDAKSNIDTNVVFRCAMDLVAYIPRAIQIVFFAPFPTQWTECGTSAGAVVMRQAAVVETLGIYVCLLFSLFALWRWRRQESIWLVVIQCFGMMVLFALVGCNVGTIYRVRYGFLMTWGALGVAGFLEVLKIMRSRCRSRSEDR